MGNEEKWSKEEKENEKVIEDNSEERRIGESKKIVKERIKDSRLNEEKIIKCRFWKRKLDGENYKFKDYRRYRKK